MTTADGKRDVTTKDIICDNGMPAFVAIPSSGGPYPTVVLMHERYGFVKHTRDQAIRCARDGYAVIAPSFFHKHPDLTVLAAGDSRYDMTDPESVELMKAALAAMKGFPAANPEKVAVCGYCQTGRHPLVFAAEVPISAAVVWYGAAATREWPVTPLQPRTLDEVISKLPCPVFAAFGEADHIISIPEVIRFRNSLEANNKSYEIYVYKDAPHGWLNDTMPGRYRKPQADAGWAAQQRFLSRVLGPDHDAATIRWRFECDSNPDYDFSKNVRME
jgi:carboxymethylenebutenolidase